MRLPSPTGPATAKLFHGLLGGVFAIAWISLGSQVRLLIGERGLTPIGAALDAAGGRLSFWDAPTHLWIFGRGDPALVVGCALGAALSLLAAAGVASRILFLVTSALYLSYTVACGSFLSFQWDSMLIEAGVLAALLPRDRPAPLAHALPRLLLFKLMVESAIAKIQSPYGDWLDGSAMTLYYETAPLPTPLARFAHALPAAWHHFESWFTLFFEGLVPFAIFGPRRLRQVAALIFALFFVVDFATANYGFFVPLSATLLVFLFDESDNAALLARLRARLGRPDPTPERPVSRRYTFVTAAFAALWLTASTAGAAHHFTDARPLPALVDGAQNLRLANVYHLFRQITRERIEPEFQILIGDDWQARDLLYKPGDPKRAPPFVAPHQPRVDFRLWFHGLAYQHERPAWVLAILRKLCDDPEAVQPLFAAPLPDGAKGARVIYWRYTYATPEERALDGSWWHRRRVDDGASMLCGG